MSNPTKHTLPLEKILNMDTGLSIIMNQKLSITPSWRFGQWKESTEKTSKSANKKRDEIIKELGAVKEDGSIEVLPENKEEYFNQYKKLIAEEAVVEIPEIPLSMLTDVPMTVRFTTLIGGYLKNDVKFPQQKYKGLTNQQVMDLDTGLSVIMDELLPTTLAMKLGEAKRVTEPITSESRNLKEELTKKLGVLNDKYDYDIKDADAKKEYEKAIEDWLDTKCDISIPALYLNDFDVKVMVKEKKVEVKFPLKFFSLISPFVKEKKADKEEESEEESEG